MNCLLHAVFIHLYFQPIPAFLNHQELAISLDLVRELQLRQCILVDNPKKEESFIFYFKEFSKANIFVFKLNYTSLVKYTITTETYNSYTGIIFKDEDLYFIQQISRMLEKVSISAVDL